MGLFLMLLELAGNWQTQLLKINQSEESSKINVNAHTTSCPLHQMPITSAAHYNHIYSSCKIEHWTDIYLLTIVSLQRLRTRWRQRWRTPRPRTWSWRTWRRISTRSRRCSSRSRRWWTPWTRRLRCSECVSQMYSSIQPQPPLYYL